MYKRQRLRTALKRRGIDFHLNAAATAIERSEADGKLLLHFTEKEKPQSVCADRVLVCVGRQPNVENLGLENAGIEYGKRGITVDEHLQTNVKGVYAAGDVTGALENRDGANYMIGLTQAFAYGLIAGKTVAADLA